jgi:hypothetical protein
MKQFPVTLTLAAFLAFSGVAYGQAFPTLSTAMSGAQEVSPPAPPGGVVTVTVGKVELRFDAGLTKTDFRLDVFRGTAVTQAHLHCAPAGVNGPVVAFLFPFNAAGVNVNGTLARGTLTNADIIPTSGAPCGQDLNNIASLLDAIQRGRVYANVHTVANPPGEVRGQVFGD